MKAALYSVHLEPPKEHDIHAFLLRHSEKFPAARRTQLGGWAAAMAELSLLREAATYGDPRSGRTARELFSDRRETARLVGLARSVYESVSSFLG